MLALPFLESVPFANAVPLQSKKRLVCMGVALGMYPGEWNPVETGKNYRLPKLLEPLEALRNDFTIISGTDHPGVSGGHKGTPAFLSGVYQPEQVGQSLVIKNQITLDQLAAKQLGKNTRFQSLQLGASHAAPDGAISWNEKGVPFGGGGRSQKGLYPAFCQ